MLKLKLQYFGSLMGRADSLEKTLMLGKIEGRRKGDDREWDGWMAPPTQWTWVWVDSGSWWWTGRLSMLQFMGLQSWTWLSDWTELNWFWIPVFHISWTINIIHYILNICFCVSPVDCEPSKSLILCELFISENWQRTLHLLRKWKMMFKYLIK